MIKPSRTRIITALLTSAVAWMGSVDAQVHATHAAKLSAVQDHLGDASKGADWSKLAKACEDSAALSSVAVDADANGIAISLELSEAVPYCISFDSQSNRLAIDLAGAIALPQLKTLVLDAGRAVKAVDATLAAVQPIFITRATIDLTSTIAVSAEYEGNKLVILTRASDAFTQAGNAAEQRSAFVDTVLAAADSRGSFVADAAENCTTAIAALQTELADAKLLLIEQEFAGMGADAESPATSDLNERIDALALDVERLASAQRDAMSESRNVRSAVAAQSGAVSMSNLVQQIQNADNATVQRLSAIAAAANSRRNDVLAAVEEANVVVARSMTGSSEAIFDALDGAFTEFRGDAAAPAPLSNLDAAIAEIGSVDVDVALDTTPMAAVKSSEGSLTGFSAPPARRASTNSFSTPMTFNPLGEVSVMHTGQEPIRLAQMESREDISFTAPRGATFQLYRRDVPPSQDPLQQPVTIDFRDMDLLNVVSLLAEKGEINVIAGTEVRGTVTASLQDIPLGRAIEIILRMNGLGIVEEAGVYRITTYEEAVESRRETRIIFLQNTRADDIEQTMRQAVRGPEASTFQVSANDETNTVVLSGPADLVNQMAAVVEKLDVTEQAIPTVTRVFRLNHAVPTEIEQIVDDILSDEGEVNSDVRSRQLVVTDTPGKIADIEELVSQLDSPVKQVAIEATIVDVVMDDTAQTGVDWVISRLPEGRLQNLSAAAAFAPPSLSGGLGSLSILSGDFDIDLLLFGEVNNNNAEILANPVVVTVENSPARITIAEEFPFREQSETGEGGLLTSTTFKDIGTILEVTPRITYENEVVVAIEVQQSSVSGLTPDNIPIEDEREVLTTLRLQDGQTVFIGGLRKFQDSVGQRKMPLLGNIPVVGVLFGNRNVVQDHVELLVFLTCNVLPNKLPELTPYQQEKYDYVSGKEMRPTGERTLVESYVHPEIYRDPFYKWRRDK